MKRDTELHNPLDPDRLTLELVDPTKPEGFKTNVDTIERAIETVRTGGRDVLLVYDYPITPRYIHALTRDLAQTDESGTSKHISTMAREMYDSLVGSTTEEDSAK